MPNVTGVKKQACYSRRCVYAKQRDDGAQGRAKRTKADSPKLDLQQVDLLNELDEVSGFGL